ncbi:2993_t:CDS:2, partial [Gigaspora rosea]
KYQLKMPPKVSSSREYLQSKPVTRKTRNTTKKSTQIEPDVSEHLQTSKRPRKSNQVKGGFLNICTYTALYNVQSNTHIERYQRSCSPSVEPQSRETYNEIQQNQRNTQIYDSPNYNSIGSSAHLPFDANIYQHKAPLQVNRRSTNSCAQSIEPRIDSFPERSDQRLSNQNHHLVEDESSLLLQMNEDESSEDENFSSFGQNYNSKPLKELSHSNIQSNMQNVNSYLEFSQVDYFVCKKWSFFQDETHLIRWLEARKDIVLQVLTSICSSPLIISNQVSSNSTPNLAKILSEQSQILFLRTRVPMKRTRTSLIKSVIPNMVKTHPDWNTISTKLRQANPSNYDIEEFITGAVWERPFKKHIDALDYDIFKNQRSGSKGEEPDYTSTVLNRIKRLDNITINATFPAASRFQYANQLDLNEEQE